MNRSGWERALAQAPWVLAGMLVGALCARYGGLDLDWKLPVLDLVQVVIAIVALIWVPRLLGRLERRQAFDREVMGQQLLPALQSVVRIEEVISDLSSDHIDGAVRDELIKLFKGLRKNIGRARRVAERWEWSQATIAAISDMEGLAGNLYRLATGSRPFTDSEHALQIARRLHDDLQDVLRSAS